MGTAEKEQKWKNWKGILEPSNVAQTKIWNGKEKVNETKISEMLRGK